MIENKSSEMVAAKKWYSLSANPRKYERRDSDSHFKSAKTLDMRWVVYRGLEVATFPSVLFQKVFK